MRLRTKLILLLLGFGVLPLAASVAIGSMVSRTEITKQATSALKELTEAQAIHLATELTRERLVLRTITGQLQQSKPTSQAWSKAVSRSLSQSLPEGGVFDGLRLVNRQGQVLANVALRGLVPHWPSQAPATDWTSGHVVVHREGETALAYILAVRAGDEGDHWLEGHVRQTDFNRLFAIPEHMMEGVESAVYDRDGTTLLVGHDHFTDDLMAVAGPLVVDTAVVTLANVGGTPSLVAAAPVVGADWIFAATLPLDVALAPLTRLRNAAALGTGALVVIIVLTGVTAGRSVSRPLHELTAAAQSFGKGATLPPLAPRSTDEVGQLVDAFNRMAQNLAESRAQIERLHGLELERAQQLATVGELASGVAHEIRNPLTGVLGAVDLALRKLPAEEPSRPLLEEAMTQLQRIEGTTTQLLRYARPPELREAVVDVNHLVERAQRVVIPQTQHATISLDIDLAEDDLQVRVDPELIVQVLVNLMLNGVDAMREGGSLTVWVARHAPEVWIGVRDTGSGISPDVRSQIFRPFFTTKHQGTGLGLPISQQIVLRHGGTLRVEDTPGGGTTFIVVLPLAQSGGESRE